MFQSILVGVSTVEHSEHAITTGFELAERGAHRIRLVHAVHSRPQAWPTSRREELAQVESAAVKRAREELRAPLETLLSRIGQEERDVDELLLVKAGGAAQVILEQAAEIDADLVVLGPHEKRMLFDFGSTARAVLSQARCAVLVQPASSRPIRRILVPVDLSEESLEALSRAQLLARELGANILTLHSFAAPEFAYVPGMNHPVAEPTYVVEQARDAIREEFDRVMGEIAWEGIEHEQRFVEGSPVHEILEAQSEVDLIVMGTHGRTGLAAAVLGNVAYGVLKHAEVPVLAIRLAKREWLA